MPFVKYESDAKPSIDVKLTSTGFTISPAALEAHNLADADFVNLYWDSDLHLIGITPSTKDDKSAFKITARGREGNGKAVAAARFFDRFGIPVEDAKVVSGLKFTDGIAAFELELPSATHVKKVYTGKPRGRKKTIVVVNEE